jgi:dihydroorotase
MFKLAPVPIVEGGLAEFIVFNPERFTLFTRDFMKSKSTNTPFLDKAVKGLIERVIYRGKELLVR